MRGQTTRPFRFPAMQAFIPEDAERVEHSAQRKALTEPVALCTSRFALCGGMEIERLPHEFPFHTGGSRVAAVPIWQKLVGVLLAIGVLVGWVIRTLPEEERKKPKEEIAIPSASVVPGPIRLEVLNGCGIQGAAGHVASFLRSAGFDVVYEGNAEHFRFTESIVMDRAGVLSAARRVAETLGIGNCVQQIKMDPYRIEDMTVIVGRDYRRMRLDEPYPRQNENP